MPQTKLTVDADDRVALIGKTGTGKTYFARVLSEPIARFVVIDSKGDIDPQKWRLETVPDNWSESTPLVRRLLRGENVRLRFRAPLNRDYRPILRLILRSKNVTLYIDEVLAVVPERRPAPEEYDALYTRGRALGIGVWASMQRPRAVPTNTLAQADWFFIFRLPRPEDRKYAAAYTSENVGQKIQDTYGFWTYHSSWTTARYTSRYVARQPNPVRQRSA